MHRDGPIALLDTPAISIVDDDDSVRSGTMRLVRSRGFVAHGFPSASAFLFSGQLAETSCLISDIQMPEMSGIELQGVLHERGYKIPIIFITAFPNDNIRIQLLDRGAVCYLTKPFDGEALLNCVEDALKSAVDRHS